MGAPFPLDQPVRSGGSASPQSFWNWFPNEARPVPEEVKPLFQGKPVNLCQTHMSEE